MTDVYAQTHSKPQVMRSQVFGGDCTPSKQTEQLRRFFSQLESGEMPDFLQMMEILSTVAEMVTVDQPPCFDCKR